MIFIPKDVEKLVKKLDKQSDVKTPWALATWMKKKGYKMPAEEDVKGPTPDVGKITLPTEADWAKAKDYKQKISDKLSKVKAEEEDMALKEKYFRKPESIKKEVSLPPTIREQAFKFKPKEKPTFILPSGPSLREMASEIIDAFLAEEVDFKSPNLKVEEVKTDFNYPQSSMGKKVKTGSPMDISRQKRQEKMPVPVKACEDDDMLVYPEEFKMGMKEETEHADVVGNDKEALKKIVLAHLKEDPKYYTKLGTVMKAEEERKPSQYAFTPYSQKEVKQHKESVVVAPPKGKPMQRPPSPPMSKPLPKSDGPHTPKVKAAPVMSPKTQQLRQQFALGKPKSQTVTTIPQVKRDIDIQDKPLETKKPMEHKGEEDQLVPHYKPKQPKAPETKLSPKDEIESFLHLHRAEEEYNPASGGRILPPKKAEEGDKLGQYLKEIEKPKDPLATIKKMPKRYEPEPPAPVPAPATGGPKQKHLIFPAPGFSKKAELIQKAEEELGEPKKAFNEDALNELYCFLRWMSDKGFKAEDGDKFESLMDQYEVEKFAEEAQPPAQFKAPEEAKAEEEKSVKSFDELYKVHKENLDKKMTFAPKKVPGTGYDVKIE